jgi:uncharacterized protein YndB with AHSA1/START domain
VVTLQHAAKIAADREAVYRALTEIEKMADWHVGSIGGEIAVGATYFLERRPGKRFGWRTEQLEPSTRIVQTYIEGEGCSPGKTLTILLSDLDDGRTQLDLSDGPWSEGDPHLAFCNAYWGEALSNLRTHLEAGA